MPSLFQRWLYKLLRTLEREVLAGSKLQAAAVPGAPVVAGYIGGAIMLGIMLLVFCANWLAQINVVLAQVVFCVLLIAIGVAFSQRLRSVAQAGALYGSAALRALVAHTREVLFEAGLLRAILYDESLSEFPELAHGQLGAPLIEVAQSLAGTPPAVATIRSFRTLISAFIQYYEQCCHRFGCSAYPEQGDGAYWNISLLGTPNSYLYLAVATVLYQELYDPEFTPGERRRSRG